MKSKYKIKFELKQHTPLIHFQADQHGATLRASELKPKLDRFLIKKAGLTEMEKGKKVPKKEMKGWFINPDKLALDYKVKISGRASFESYLPLTKSLNNEKRDVLANYIQRNGYPRPIIIAPTPYFANEDKLRFLHNEIDSVNTNLDALSFAIKQGSNIHVEIISFHLDLLDEIKRVLTRFFLTTNFGSRQNKGFGSFTIEKIDGLEVRNSIPPNYIAVSSRVRRSEGEIFRFIHGEYQLLKSGVNYPQYEKSRLFRYFLNAGIRWEKRFIKRQINANKISGKNLYHENGNKPIDLDDETEEFYNDYEDKQNNQYQFIRALLGLSEQYSFLIFAENEGQVNDLDRFRKYIVKLKHIPSEDKLTVERFQSPILFKVIDGKVYIIIDGDHSLMFNKVFSVRLSLENSNQTRDLGTICTPSKFDLTDFLIQHLNREKWRIQE